MWSKNKQKLFGQNNNNNNNNRVIITQTLQSKFAVSSYVTILKEKVFAYLY